MFSFISANRKPIIYILIIALAISALFLSSCNNNQTEKKVIFATTTTVQDSGILDVLISRFRKQYDIDVQTVVGGSSEVLRQAQMGNADVILVHAPKKELEFMNSGFGAKRENIMKNYFIVTGPSNDPAKVALASSPQKAFQVIKDTKSNFVSRDDQSGTNIKEDEIWKLAGIKPEGEWYKKSGVGMAETIIMANELRAYVFTDSATFLQLQKNLKIKPLFDKKVKILENIYSVIKVKSSKKNEATEIFYKWLNSKGTQDFIVNYKGKAEKPLFLPVR